MLQLIAITNDANFWRSLELSGCDRLMIDLELIGKKERQHGLDSVVSEHTLEDVQRMRAEFPDSEMIVRVNPLHCNSETELEDVLAEKPEHIMLPMFRSRDEIDQIARIIDARAGLIPLVETLDGLKVISNLSALPRGVSELFFGLNDLHIEMQCSFMFEALLDTRLRIAMARAGELGVFGFGGIAQLDQGLISGRHVLAFHSYFGSQGVILSRSFKQAVSSSELGIEVSKLKSTFSVLYDDSEKTERLVAEGIELLERIGNQ